MNRRGTAYIPDGETRTLTLVGEYYAYRNGNLFVWVEIDELETDDRVLLNQFSAEDLYIAIREQQPDPGARVRVSRDGSYFKIEWSPGDVEAAEDAM